MRCRECHHHRNRIVGKRHFPTHSIYYIRCNKCGCRWAERRVFLGFTMRRIVRRDEARAAVAR